VTLQGVERLKSLARLVLAASLGLAFLLAPPRGTPLYWVALITFALYFVYAFVVLVFRRQLMDRGARAATLAGDAAALVVVLLLGPNLPAAFLLFFVYFTLVAGLWRGWRAAALLSLAVSAAYVAVSWREVEAATGASWWSALPLESWLVVSGLLVAGACFILPATAIVGALLESDQLTQLGGLGFSAGVAFFLGHRAGKGNGITSQNGQ